MRKRRLTFNEATGLSSDELRSRIADGYLPPIAGGASVESNINSLWAACQTSGRGVPAGMVGATKKFRWVGGDVNTARADGTEPYSDGTLFGDTVDFVNTLNGSGAPVLQGQPGAIAYTSWLACGQEVVTGGVNDIQTITSTATGGSIGVSINGYSTTIAWNSTAAAAQTQLLALTNAVGGTFPATSIAVTGGPLNTTPLVVTFQGQLGKQLVPLLTLDNTAATGGTATIVHTTPGSNFLHVATPADVGGFYSTWLKSVGKSVIYRGQFNDCRISNLRFEGSSASKVVKVTPTLLVLDPGQVPAGDPTQNDDGTRPFIYTEAAGTFTIDGQVYRGHSAFAIEAQWGLQEWYGDDVVPFDIVNTRATVVLQGITIILDAAGLARYNTQLYNTPTPATNAKPVKTIPALGSYQCQFNRISPYTGGISESAKFEVPSVKWDPNLTIPANPAGGPVELPLAGEFRKAAGQPAFRISVGSHIDPAYSS